MDYYNHSPTPQDVYTVRYTLLHFLPAELANLIIEEAQYWPRISSTSDLAFSPLIVKPNESKCCILSPRLTVEGPTDSPIRISEIHFRIESHDQGWGGDNLPGPYDGSYTWFEAVIVRDSRIDNEMLKDMLETRETVPPARSNRDPAVYVRRMLCESSSWLPSWFTGRPSSQWVSLVTVKNPSRSSDTWDIQRNLRASGEYQTRTIVWRKELDRGVDETALYNATGSSLGADFLKSLCPGDRIAVMARAQYPGWINYVKSVSVDIFYSV